MDTRMALKRNTVLSCGDGFRYVVKRELSRGGSCIVYDAVYQVGGDEKPVRLKECYPFNLEIERLETGELRSAHGDRERFEKAKNRIRKAFREGNGLFLTKGLTNAVSNMMHCFEQNNTIYIPSVYLEGETLSCNTFSSLKDCISIVKTVSNVVDRIHQAGYLYLDIKPGNVYVLTDASGKCATELVQLFDFDSLVEVEDLKQGNVETFRISYTKGFAALEHQMGQFSRIGFHTDVYSVGALLFYLIFGTPPRAADCEERAMYDFEKSKYGDTGYQDRLFQKLTEFFHHTLANYRFDRYQTMRETAEKLAELIQLADKTVPYVLSTTVIPGRCFIGRKSELLKLREWSEQEADRCLFLTGMGGIGKSSLARKFLLTESENFDTFLYLYFQNSIQKLITDDNGLQINTVEQEKEETETDYFNRKLRTLKRLLVGKRALLVIDNFHGEITEDFLKVLGVGWKVLVLSRAVPPSDDYAHISLEAFQNRGELYRLFEQYAGRQVGKEETVNLDHLIEKVEGHTLAMELIARQIRKSRLTIAEAERLAESSGFSGMAPEKIRYEKDNRTKTETIRNIISAVFFYHGEESEKRRILKVLSLFGQKEVAIHMFMEMLDLSSKGLVNELEEEGWLIISGTQLSMHPVIQEAVALWKWEKQYRADAGLVMEYLYTCLKPEADHGEYQIISHDNLKRGTDQRKVKELVQLSENVLENCGLEESLRKTEIWKKLQGLVLLCMPVYREKYIIRHTRILMEDSECQKGDMMMRLYQKLLSVYLERHEIQKAWKLLGKIKGLARGKNYYVKAQYYDMMADYYDTCLDGQYASNDEENNLGKLLKAIEHSILYMRMARGERRDILLTEYMLNKANVLIRSIPEKTVEIKKLLNRAGKWIQKNTQTCSKLRWSHMMSLAWYYTLSEPDEETAEFYCQSAETLVNYTCETELEYIDTIVIPHANMMTEFDNLEKAKKILLDGIHICERYPEMFPYIRKKRNLYDYLLEVCYYSQNKEECRRVIQHIEKETKCSQKSEILCEIPEEIRRFAGVEE